MADETEEVEGTLDPEDNFSEAWDEAVDETLSEKEKGSKEGAGGDKEKEKDEETGQATEVEGKVEGEEESAVGSEEKEQHDWQARYEDLQKGLTKKVSEKDQEIQRLKTENAELKGKVAQKEDILDIFKDEIDEDTREALEERPEIRKVLNLLMRKMTPKEPEKPKDGVEAGDETPVSTPSKPATPEEFDKILSLKYPKWGEIVQSKPFQEWVGKQSKELQLIYHHSADPLESITVLDAFQKHVRKEKLGSEHNARQDAMRGSVTKSGNNRSGSPKAADPSDYDAAWEEAVGTN